MAETDYTAIVEQMRRWAEALAPILEREKSGPTVAIVAQLQDELHQTADDLESRGLKTPEPPTCPDCGSFLTDRVTNDAGAPSYCDTCDRAVREEGTADAAR